MGNKVKHVTTITVDLTSAAIPFLLNSYKHGLFDLGDVFTKTSFLDKIEKNNYATFHSDTFSGKKVTVMQLTQKGAAFVQNHFIEMLTTLSPYYLFPIIKRGDKVLLTQDVQNVYDKDTGILKKKLVSSPSGSSSLDKGIYTVQSCDSSSIAVTDDCYILYRLRLAEFRDVLRLCADQLKAESEELKERFGVIRLQSLVGRLQEKVNTIKLAELIDELYSMPHTKDRISNG